MTERQPIIKKTSSKRPKKGPKKPFNGAKDGIPFTKNNQPSPASKRKGWAKKRALNEIVKMTFIGNTESRLLEQMAAYFGVAKTAITIEMMMDFRQIEKAIGKSDTKAYEAIKDRIYGKPKQQTDLTTNGKDISGGKEIIEVSLSI